MGAFHNFLNMINFQITFSLFTKYYYWWQKFKLIIYDISCSKYHWCIEIVIVYVYRIYKSIVLTHFDMLFSIDRSVVIHVLFIELLIVLSLVFLVLILKRNNNNIIFSNCALWPNQTFRLNRVMEIWSMLL